MSGIGMAAFLADLPTVAIETYSALMLLMIVGYLSGDGTRALIAGLIAVTLAPNPGSLVVVVVLTLLVKIVTIAREVLR